ncbi:MAG: FumA C-terminus/TtdB family hydratase beta subunit [Pseudomonadota bacterium]
MEEISQEMITQVAYTLLSNTAIKYPKNFFEKLVNGLRSEENPGSKSVFISIIENILYAIEGPTSICQDTGVPTFHVYLNPGISVKGNIETALTEATIGATEKVPIRRNVVEPFTFQNPGNNTGWGVPFIYYHYHSQPGSMRLRAELKGFGGEIKSTSDWIFTSTESMADAVLAYVLNNVLLSKGEGCIPGFLGIGVGGYASEAMFNAKNAVFRELSEKAAPESPDDNQGSLRQLEERIFRCVNSLGLGPMGGGGKAATLGVYLERRGTHTAVAPVAVSQQCWASRGSEALIGENRVEYLTAHLERGDIPALREGLLREFSTSEAKGSIHELNLPANPEDLLKLRAWDVVYLNGIICTSRDGAHRRMVERVKEGKRGEIPKEILENGTIYHCGPVIAQEGDGWHIEAAGPTTSSRFTTDAAFLVENGIIKISIGKGTMGEKMIKALKGRGIYLKAVGGCAVAYQKMIKRADVTWLDLGYPEAAWIFDVKNFGPLVVGIDSMGNSLTANIMEDVYENARRIYRQEGLDPEKRYVQYPQTFAGLSLEEVIEKAKGA